ncbi:MAG: diguanylate cyclase [Pseudomonadota bacterium]
MKYIGILSTKALLKLINEKNITLARNQNPLTRLPGNTMIHEYFSKSLSDFKSTYHLIYFDFDNFKPYNDLYGFRNGDRLILMFADLLKQAGFNDNRFIGHIGGDDFFMGIQSGGFSIIEPEMKELARQFQKNAESFYDRDALEKGFVIALDRGNNTIKIPLITVSIAILELPGNMERPCSIEDAANMIAQLKKEAKQSETRIASAGIMEFLNLESDSETTSYVLDLSPPAGPVSTFKRRHNAYHLPDSRKQ